MLAFNASPSSLAIGQIHYNGRNTIITCKMYTQNSLFGHYLYFGYGTNSNKLYYNNCINGTWGAMREI